MQRVLGIAIYVVCIECSCVITFVWSLILLENQESMASNRGHGGIQQLLAAEQEAQHIVAAARNGNHSILILVELSNLLYFDGSVFIHANCLRN